MDLSGLHNVFHYGIPASLDDFVQETGRIGRDGHPSYSVVLVHKDSNRGKNISQPSKDFTTIQGCLRTKLLSYFCEINTATPSHTCCSECHRELITMSNCEHYSGCFCVKWQRVPNYFTSPLDSYPASTQVEPQVVRPLYSNLTELRNRILLLGSDLSNPFLPTHVATGIYPKFLDALMEHYRCISSVEDIIAIGAYSRQVAQNVLNILNECVPLVAGVSRSRSSVLSAHVDVMLNFSDSDE